MIRDVDFRELETILKMVGLDREYHLMATPHCLYLFGATSSAEHEKFGSFEALSEHVHKLANEKMLLNAK